MSSHHLSPLAGWRAVPLPLAQERGRNSGTAPSTRQGFGFLDKSQPVQVAALDGSFVVSYNTAFLYGMTSTTDIRTLLAGSGVPPGFQRVDFYINQMLAAWMSSSRTIPKATKSNRALPWPCWNKAG
jgi:outer membrane usher protein